MIAILDHIQALEAYLERAGARVVRTSLPECVHGRVFCDVISLRVGLRPEQELPALVHEVTHWLAHRHARPGPHCTLFEYEAEAVETLVMRRLGLQPAEYDPFGAGQDSPTDGRLPAAVRRVLWASSRICGALGLESQAPVHFEAAAGKEVVFENE